MAEMIAYKMIPKCTKDEMSYVVDELVRCKDCKLFGRHEAKPIFGWGESYHCNNPRCNVYDNIPPKDPDWFCADGEKGGDNDGNERPVRISRL